MARLRRTITAALFLILVTTVIVGCQGLDPGLAQLGDPTLSARLKVPDLTVLPGPGQLTAAQLQEGLRQYLNGGEGAVVERLNFLYGRWTLPRRDDTLILEADLDGDGTTEVITAINDASSALGSGTLFVIYRKDGSYEVDRSPDTVLGASIHTTADLTGDGRQEIIWSSSSAGANTVFNTIFVSTWEPGRIEQLPGEMKTSYGTVEAQGRELIISGGLQGGWGAGLVQRLRKDHYLWADGEMRLVNQWFAPSAFGYHRLVDGILAEQWNRTQEAAQAFHEAMERTRDVLTIEDTVPAEWQEPFDEAVRTLARFRLGLLHLTTGSSSDVEAVLAGATGPYVGLVQALIASTPTEACREAAAWATEHPDFLTALNIPRGYVNPQWAPTDLCGPLPSY